MSQSPWVALSAVVSSTVARTDVCTSKDQPGKKAREALLAVIRQATGVAHRRDVARLLDYEKHTVYHFACIILTIITGDQS